MYWLTTSYMKGEDGSSLTIEGRFLNLHHYMGSISYNAIYYIVFVNQFNLFSMIVFLDLVHVHPVEIYTLS